MEFAIRPFVTGDEPGVCAAVKAVYDEFGFTWDPERYHADLYDLAGHYGGPDQGFWVAESKDGIAGCVGLACFPAIEGEPGTLAALDGVVRIAGCDCDLHRLYVRADARRSGVGGRLFEATLEAARARGARLMELWSDKRFVDAHRLYERYGARVVGDRVCDDPDESPEWGLALPL